MNLLSISGFHHRDKHQGALSSQTVGPTCWSQQDSRQRQLVSERLRRVLLIRESQAAHSLHLQGQDSGTCSWVSAVSTTSSGAFRMSVNSGGDWDLQRKTRGMVFLWRGWDIYYLLKMISRASLEAHLVKNLPAMQETQFWFLRQGRSPEEGNDNLLQYFVWTGGPWWATVHGVAKNWTWLSN